VNKLAVNLPPKRVDHGYLKVLIVAEALVSEALGNFFAMPDRFCICLEFDSNCVSMRDAIFHIDTASVVTGICTKQRCSS
jgi:hypothetical protein